MNFYPIKLKPVSKNIIWGGTRLKEDYGKTADFPNIAESWELTVRPDGMSVIDNGKYSGMTLGEFIAENTEVMGTDCAGGDFPLLIKFIDSGDDLSIQVHPDEEYAAKVHGEHGKTEMWYVMDADEDAALIYGLREGVTRDDFNDHIGKGDISTLLNKISVKKGDVFFIPSGLVHAICRGVLIAEIQQNSNITYRIYDYDRIGTDGQKRELHTSHASNTVKCYTDAEIRDFSMASRVGRRKNLTDGKVLCDCKYFRVTKNDVANKLTFTVDEKAFVSLLFTEAEDISVSCGGECLFISKGDSVFIPAGAGEVTVIGHGEFILSEV